MANDKKVISGDPQFTTRDYVRRFFHRFQFHTAKTDQGFRNAIIPREGNDFRPKALRPQAIGAYAAIIIIVKIVAIGFVSFYAQRAQQSDITPTTIIALTNQARRSNKVAVLHSNALLTKAAQAKANDMVRAHYFAHISPTKVTPWFWFKQAGYSYSYAGENLAIDFIDSEDVIQAWLNSPSHRANLLNSKYKDVGVAVTTGQIDGVDSLLVVQMFGAPLPKPVVKVAKTPVQTPSPTTTQKQLAQLPAPKPVPVPPPVVLGETAPPTPPSQPTIATPQTGSLTRTSAPMVVGQAEPGSTVLLFVNSKADGSTVAPTNGVYTITPEHPVPEGTVELSVTATARGVSSQSSQISRITIDTTQPSIQADATYALFSAVDPGKLDIWTATSSDATQAGVLTGATNAPLVEVANHHYQGQVTLTPAMLASGGLAVEAQDVVGNQTSAVLVNPELFSTGVVSPSSGIGVNALRAVFFSRAFLTVFLILMLTAATVNIVVQIERQHHPTVVATMLVIYLTGALLFV